MRLSWPDPLRPPSRIKCCRMRPLGLPSLMLRRASKLFVLVRQPPYRRALRHGVAASTEHDRTPLQHDYRTILDVGANRGQFGLVAMRRFPHASLVCFEPLPGPRATLERVLASHPRLRIVDAAVAASTGRSILHVTRADDSSSLLRTTELQVQQFPGTEIVEELSVATERLDTLIDRAELAAPVLLKIDVQGTELDVLRGAVDLLKKVDTVLVECSFVVLYSGQALADDVIGMLRGQGFSLVDIAAPTTNSGGRVVQADLVFERSST